MSKQYRWKVPGINFKLLAPDAVENVRNNFGKGQSSVKYMYDSKGKPYMVLLISKNIADITNAIENGVWEHSQRPKHLEAGMTAYILPTKALSQKFPHLAHGAWFRVAGQSVDSKDSGIRWQSEMI
jgi:hypothetical protein